MQIVDYLPSNRTIGIESMRHSLRNDFKIHSWRQNLGKVHKFRQVAEPVKNFDKQSAAQESSVRLHHSLRNSTEPGIATENDHLSYKM
jgi:hypothetical protein